MLISPRPSVLSPAQRARSLARLDKDMFVREMLELLQPLETVGCAQCFEFIHKAYCAAAGQHQWVQNPAPHLFYHIHNPTAKELESFLRHYPQANMLKLVRHPIQGLESWMRSDLNAYEKLLENPHALPPGGNLLDNCLTASWQKSAQKAAQRIHSVQDSCTGNCTWPCAARGKCSGRNLIRSNFCIRLFSIM